MKATLGLSEGCLLNIGSEYIGSELGGRSRMNASS